MLPGDAKMPIVLPSIPAGIKPFVGCRLPRRRVEPSLETEHLVATGGSCKKMILKWSAQIVASLFAEGILFFVGRSLLTFVTLICRTKAARLY